MTLIETNEAMRFDAGFDCVAGRTKPQLMEWLSPKIYNNSPSNRRRVRVYLWLFDHCMRLSNGELCLQRSKNAMRFGFKPFSLQILFIFRIFHLLMIYLAKLLFAIENSLPKWYLHFLIQSQSRMGIFCIRFSLPGGRSRERWIEPFSSVKKRPKSKSYLKASLEVTTQSTSKWILYDSTCVDKMMEIILLTVGGVWYSLYHVETHMREIETIYNVTIGMNTDFQIVSHMLPILMNI